MSDDILSSPCKWCGFNGAGYWQMHTHDKSCPFFNIGGETDRTAWLVRNAERVPLYTLEEVIDMILACEDLRVMVRNKSNFYPPELDWVKAAREKILERLG